MTSALIPVWAAGGAIAAPDATKINVGWLLGEKPPHEYMNWWQNGMTLRLNHVLQQGVPEWIATTAYAINAIVKRGGLLYRATTANQNSAPPSANWLRISQDAGALTAGVLPSARLAGSYLNIQAMEGSSTATFTAFVSKLGNGFRATPTADETKADFGWVGYSGHGLRLAADGGIKMLVGGVTRALWPASGGGMSITGPLSVSGVLSGNGSGLTALNASNVGAGTLADARLPGTMSPKVFEFSGAVPGLTIRRGSGVNIGMTFEGSAGEVSIGQGASGTFAVATAIGNLSSSPAFWVSPGTGIGWSGPAAGNGSLITALNASNLSAGTVPNARISGAYSGFTNLTASGVVAADILQGGGVQVVGSGTAALPAIWLSGTRDLGIFFSGNSGVGFSVGGLVRLIATANTIGARNGAKFDGDAGGLSNIPAAELAGTISPDRLPTSAAAATWVGGRMAALPIDAIGAHLFLGLNTGNGPINPGSNYAGSTLHYSGGFQGGGATDLQGIESTNMNPPGTWKALGRATGTENNPNYAATLFKRIA